MSQTTTREFQQRLESDRRAGQRSSDPTDAQIIDELRHDVKILKAQLALATALLERERGLKALTVEIADIDALIDANAKAGAL